MFKLLYNDLNYVVPHISYEEGGRCSSFKFTQQQCMYERYLKMRTLVLQANITAIRRVRKSDNNRIARACGATIVNRTEELKEEDIGTGAGLFEIKKVLLNCSILVVFYDCADYYLILIVNQTCLETV